MTDPKLYVCPSSASHKIEDMYYDGTWAGRAFWFRGVDRHQLQRLVESLLVLPVFGFAMTSATTAPV
jgi:hypothetical protein